MLLSLSLNFTAPSNHNYSAPLSNMERERLEQILKKLSIEDLNAHCFQEGVEEAKPQSFPTVVSEILSGNLTMGLSCMQKEDCAFASCLNRKADTLKNHLPKFIGLTNFGVGFLEVYSNYIPIPSQPLWIGEFALRQIYFNSGMLPWNRYVEITFSSWTSWMMGYLVNAKLQSYLYNTPLRLHNGHHFIMHHLLEYLALNWYLNQ